ncbi:MAG: SPFH domain-containing protein [Xanthomonadales bacterium]|jgi:regulator of protease activity HflC (stomatin/prohibitin superfamily)|nr:SPFH domain-containing protein [Gammaproteobacteria bacterium]NNJ65536.1 SPFH domain-containing protein [Xanthomonadales bacterium]NNK31559.1 SPFH domain-containing protein [Xanthomonadales bacterium]NNK38353.1 SPFH domain-containing protein [Xanthomonadales bacterium]
MIKEQIRSAASGYLALAVLPALVLLFGWLFIRSATSADTGMALVYLLVLAVVLVCFKGFFMVHPNQAKVLQLFGTYVGTVRQTGLRWANPFYSKEPVSLRVRNFESGQMKVNDSVGNPIEIAAVVVWKVVDSAEAVFEVDDYESFVHIQSEAALRNLSTSYPYEAHGGEEVALRSHPNEIADKLREEVQDRLDRAGVEVIEARISHLAYAQEIASAMLKRQQAQAIVAARTQIVDGAVGMVRMALTELEQQGVVDLDEERKASMVSNLLVVLCGEENARPVLNTGSLYN